jgi:glutamate receptor, ionotropic, invertebrate
MIDTYKKMWRNMEVIAVHLYYFYFSIEQNL